MAKSFYILLIYISFGLIFMPSEVYSCTSKKVINSKISKMKSCCVEQDSKIADQKDAVGDNCCNKSKSTQPVSKKSHHNCDGHCSHNSCNCASLSFSIYMSQAIDLQLRSCIFISKNNIIPHNENRLPSGFHFIWLPPVII